MCGWGGGGWHGVSGLDDENRRGGPRSQDKGGEAQKTGDKADGSPTLMIHACLVVRIVLPPFTEVASPALGMAIYNLTTLIMIWRKMWTKYTGV